MTSKQKSTKNSNRIKGSQKQYLTKNRICDDTDISKLSETSVKKRRQIIDAAIECFLEFGYQGTSMNTVASRAGVIKQTIYSHFVDKETLFKSIIQSVTLDYVRSELASPNMVNKSSRDILLKFAQAIISRHQDPRYEKFFRTMIGEIGRFPELAELFFEATVKPGTRLATSLLSNEEEFEIPDPDATARVFMGAIVNYCMQQYILRGEQFFPFDKKRILKEIMRLVDLHKKSK